MRFSLRLFALLPIVMATAGCTPPPTQELALADMVPRGDEVSADAPAATVYFDVGSAALTVDGIAALERLADDPSRPRWSGVAISGHADRSGSVRLNRRLSAARVEAVRQYLLKVGVTPALIATEALGKRQAKPGSEAGDRRVEVFITR